MLQKNEPYMLPKHSKLQFKDCVLELKKRIEAIKPTLKEIGYGSIVNGILTDYPEYREPGGVLHIKEVWDKRRTDSKLTEILEKIAQIKEDNQTIN